MPSDTHTLTVRMPETEFDALRTYASVTGASMNETVIRAVREFLSSRGRVEEFESAVEKVRTHYRVALDKLAE